MEKGLLLWEKLWGLYVEKRIVAENKYCHTQTPSTWKQLRQAAATTRMQRKNLILQRQAELLGGGAGGRGASAGGSLPAPAAASQPYFHAPVAKDEAILVSRQARGERGRTR